MDSGKKVSLILSYQALQHYPSLASWKPCPRGRGTEWQRCYELMERDSDSRGTGRPYPTEVMALKHFLEEGGLTPICSDSFALGWALKHRPIGHLHVLPKQLLPAKCPMSPPKSAAENHPDNRDLLRAWTERGGPPCLRIKGLGGQAPTRSLIFPLVRVPTHRTLNTAPHSMRSTSHVFSSKPHRNLMTYM